MDNGQERRKKTIEDSMTEQVHLIMQQHLNGSGRLFGGALMQWIDEVAGIVAMRHAETHRVVTAAVDNLQFKRAVYEGDILVLRGYVTYVGKTSMEVEIDTYTGMRLQKCAVPCENSEERMDSDVRCRNFLHSLKKLKIV